MGTPHLPRPSSLELGDRWGCVAFNSENHLTWQCWDARGQRPWETGLEAWRVPWLAAPISAIGPDRLCARERGSMNERCWKPPVRGLASGIEVPVEVRSPSDPPDLRWGVLSEPAPCTQDREVVTCHGPGYSPPDNPGRLVRVRFDEGAPVGHSAVLSSGRAAPWRDNCLARRGCTRAPIAVHKCGFLASGRNWSDLSSEAESLNGEEVRVRGVLAVGALSITAIDCGEGGCCNGSKGPIVLAGARDVLALRGLACNGDDSEACCDAPAYGQT